MFTIFTASPSAIAVFPTPGSPIKTGLFFVLRFKIFITRIISFSLPITLSISPFFARSLRLVPYESRKERFERCFLLPKNPRFSRFSSLLFPFSEFSAGISPIVILSPNISTEPIISLSCSFISAKSSSFILNCSKILSNGFIPICFAQLKHKPSEISFPFSIFVTKITAIFFLHLLHIRIINTSFLQQIYSSSVSS